MNREPIALYIFRIIISIGLFVFMCMLYWSSLLIEEDLKTVKIDLAQVKQEMSSLRSRPVQQTERTNSTQQVAENKPRPHIDPNLPNLLTADPFYATTLPKLLGPSFVPQWTFQRAALGKPDNLHPFSNWSHIAEWIDQCIASVSTQQFGIYETMAPDMAIKMEARPRKNSTNSEFWVHLRDDVYWQPLSQSFFPDTVELAPHFLKPSPVTAHDFRFYFDALMNPYVEQTGAAAIRNYLGDIEEIEVIDDYTFVVRWKEEKVKMPDGKEEMKIKYAAKLLTGGLKPLAGFIYKYFPDGKRIIEDDSDPSTYRTNSVWAQNFSKHWAQNIIPSCGGWTFDGMTDRQILFKRNPNFYNPLAVLVEGQEITFKNGLEGVWEDFKLGKLDTYNLQPQQVAELNSFLESPEYKAQVEKGMAIKKIQYINRSYSYIGWNEARPYFKDKKVRQALTMAIDRKRIIQQNLNGMGVEIHGNFFVNSKNNDPKLQPIPFNPEASRRLLREAGWYDSDGDGIIDKEIDGKRVPFRFTLTYYVKDPTAEGIGEYVVIALKNVGIDCKLNGVDIADISAIFDDKNFDALQLAWALGTPPEEPKQLWHSSGKLERGSSNVIGFDNKEIDHIITQLQFEYNPEKRIELYRRFDDIMYEEQPYTVLYTPKTTLLYREYVQNVFIPADHQDLIPGADIESPQNSIFWLKKRGEQN